MADPIDAAVIRAALVSTAREVFGLFQRTAMLPTLYEARDFSISIFDDRLNLVADAPGIPEFVGSLTVALENIVAVVQADAPLRPGDVILANEPYVTGGHPNDAALVAPAFADGRLVGFCGMRAHMGDLGGITSYPMHAQSMYDEGLLIPPSLLLAQGVPDERLLATVAANSRQRRETVGNLRSAAAAVFGGAAKIAGIVERYGRDAYHEAVDQLLDAAEHDARRLLAEIPDGEYHASEELELAQWGGRRVPLRCSVRVAGSDVTVDVTGSADEQPGALNVPVQQTIAACRLAVKRLTTQNGVTANSGEFRMLTVVAPPGSIFNAGPPAASFVMATTASLLSEMVVTALSPAMPTRVMATSGGHTTGFVAWMEDGPHGRSEEVDDVAAIGYGATPDRDGMNALLHFCLAGMELAGGEVLEARANVTKRRLELVTDSGGPGLRRGGLGTRAVWQFDGATEVSVQAQKTEHAGGFGLAGGLAAGGRNDVTARPGRPDEQTLGMASGTRLAAGDVIVVNGAGGGGYGDPLLRAVDDVVSDVLDGYVSVEAAAEHYGVVVRRATGSVDADATESLRAILRRAALEQPGGDDGRPQATTTTTARRT